VGHHPTTSLVGGYMCKVDSYFPTGPGAKEAELNKQMRERCPRPRAVSKKGYGLWAMRSRQAMPMNSPWVVHWNGGGGGEVVPVTLMVSTHAVMTRKRARTREPL
jgi:hypothetical protein